MEKRETSLKEFMQLKKIDIVMSKDSFGRFIGNFFYSKASFR